MINISQRPGSKNRLLSPEQVVQVHNYALEVLERVGCKVMSPEALDILGQAGCNVADRNRVKFPRRLVMEAIETAPKQIEVFSRDGEVAMNLRTDACYYGTGSDCPKIIDLDTGERRASVKQDVGDLARFCNALPNIDFVMSFGIAQDAPDGGDFVHGYEAMLLNTTKPAIVTGHGRNDMRTMIEMAACVCGGLNELRDQPCLILYSEPMSPLIHTEMGVDKGLVCCEHGIPFIYIGSPMMAANGPATIQGTLVQAVAECLSGLVIFQNKQPGAKFIFGGDASVMDMRSMIYSYGCPELNLMNAGLADMAHYYGLPFFCIAGATDSKVLDAQAGLEYAMGLYNATLNGCNLIHDCGYLESGLTSSFESVLFADEIISMIRYMLQPLDFNLETVPLEAMEIVGPGGTFLDAGHTQSWFRKSFWFPRYLDRRNFERWCFAGGQDIARVLNEKAREIFTKNVAPAVPIETRQQISAAIARHQPDV